MFQVIGVDQLGRGAPVPEGGRELGQVAQAGRAAAVRPVLELAVRDNLLTPQDRSEGIFTFAAARNCGVLINKPLAQGLLTGSYDPAAPRMFGEGDHRCRKRWFTPDALAILTTGLDKLRKQVGPTTAHVVRIALWSCLQRYEHAAVLVGFTTPDQIEMNLTCLGLAPTDKELATAREIMARVQAQLDASGEVFLDERPAQVAP